MPPDIVAFSPLFFGAGLRYGCLFPSIFRGHDMRALPFPLYFSGAIDATLAFSPLFFGEVFGLPALITPVHRGSPGYSVIKVPEDRCAILLENKGLSSTLYPVVYILHYMLFQSPTLLIEVVVSAYCPLSEFPELQSKSLFSLLGAHRV